MSGAAGAGADSTDYGKQSFRKELGDLYDYSTLIKERKQWQT
jgi:hypothetical protein